MSIDTLVSLRQRVGLPVNEGACGNRSPAQAFALQIDQMREYLLLVTVQWKLNAMLCGLFVGPPFGGNEPLNSSLNSYICKLDLLQDVGGTQSADDSVAASESLEQLILRI